MIATADRSPETAAIAARWDTFAVGCRMRLEVQRPP